MFDTNSFLTTTKLFWQYPAITEQTFYEQNKENDNYLGIPWATLIDKRNSIDFNHIVHLIKINQQPNVTYYTCCQHIIFHILVPIWKALNITVVYISHKIMSIDAIDGIELKPCPLYAVNIENFKLFNNVDSIKRDILYSFIGAYQPDYLTGIRLAIFNMKHPENTIIKNTREWHYNKLVYHPSQNVNHDMNITQEHVDKTNYYNEILLRSRFTLAPSGTGPNSIRFWEALGAGSIPILLADTLELPEHELWHDAIIRIAEKELYKVYQILGAISEEEEKRRRENCLTIYNFFKDNFANKREILNKNDINFHTFTIDLPLNYIKGYYKCFGHFITDHLFMLFKFKYYLKSKNINIENLNLNCLENEIKPFMIQLYKAIFKNITFNKKLISKSIYLGIVLGSIENSENKKIYLAKSTYYSNVIPKELYTNIRRVNEDNKLYSRLFREHILNYFNIETKEPLGVLIINRLSNGRKWDNLNLLTDKLKEMKISHMVKELEQYSIREQIEMVYNSKYIIFPSGSSQGHLFWVRPKVTICIECFIPGHRYINTILYAINLDLYIFTLFDIFYNYNINNINNKNIKELLVYQKSAKLELNSKIISKIEINKEIDWFELYLLPENANYYMRQCTENIDMKLKLNRIIYIINDN